MKHVSQVYRYFGLLLLAFTLTACAGLQVDTFNRKMAAAYTGVSTATQLSATAYTSGKISKAQKNDVATKLDLTLDVLKTAEITHTSNPVLGESHLNKALVLISAVQAFLATQGAK